MHINENTINIKQTTMIKKLQFKSWLLMLCMLVGVGNVWADDVVYYTLTPAAGSNNGYANNCDVTISGITWNITGNAQMVPWRIGGKSLSSVDRTLYSKTAMGSAITKVVAQIGAASGITINSVKLTVASDASFSNQIDEMTIDGGVEANSTLTFNPTSETSWATGAYYKFTFNVTVSGTSNKFLEFGGATFYKEDDGVIVKTDPEVSLSPLTINVGEQATGEYPQELSDFEVESSDASIAEAVYVDGTITVNGKAAGTATITATWSETTNYNSGYKTFEVTVKAPATVEDGVFDFTLGLNYGTGLTASNDGTEYITTDYTWTAGNVTLVTSGKYRWWSTDGTLRVFAPESGNTTLSLSVPDGKVITEIVITGGNNYMTLSPSVGTYSGGTWTGSAQSVVFSRGGQNAQIKTITVTYGEGIAKQDAELSFSASAYTATIGGENTFPTLANPHSLPVTYSSSNEEVATVAADGTITLVAAGTTTITASSAETDTYNPGSASYSLTVENAPTPIDENVIEWDFTVNSWGLPEGSTNKQTESASFSDGTHTIILAAADGYYFHTTGKYLLFGKSGSTLTFHAFEKDVEKIVVIGNSGASASTKQNIFVGDTPVSTETTGAKETNTYLIADDYQAAGTIYTLKVTSDHNTQVTKIIIYLKDTVTPIKKDAGLAYEQSGFNVNLGDDFTAPVLVNPYNLTVTYTSSNTDLATVDAATGAVTLIAGATGTTVITASFEGNDNYRAGEASYTLTVVDPNANDGSAENPYTVAQAIDAINAGTGTEGVYAKGVVSKIVTPYNSQYGNISYNISADGTMSGQQLQAYRGFSYNGDWFTSADDIKVGDEVVVYGNLTKYNTTYEFEAGNQLVSLVRTDNREPAGLSYDVANFTATIGEANEFPVLANSNGLTVTYSSTNEDAATIDAATGEITLVAAGQTTIKATFAGNDNYEPGEASYMLVVKEKEVAGTDKFELVTDVTTLSDGDVIILVASNEVEENVSYYALSTTQNSNNRAANEVTVNEDNTITPGSSIQQITLEEGFYFNVGDGYLYAASAGSNWLRTETEADDNAKATIEIADNGDATIIFQGANTRNHLRFNPNSGNPMFSCYAESSSVVALPRIYRKVASSETLKGDVNRDGKQSIADVTALVNIILGKVTEENNPDDYDFKAADVNNDGSRSIADVTALVNIILGKTE